MENELKFLVVDRRRVADPAAQAEWSAKKLVWIPDDAHGFVSASIKEEKKDEYVVALDGGKKKNRQQGWYPENEPTQIRQGGGHGWPDLLERS